MIKRLILVWLFLIFIIGLAVVAAQAGPFLVCEPAPTQDQVTHIRVTLNDVVLSDIPYEIGPSGKVVIYDIGTLDDGAHEFNEIRFVNIRGQSEPVPFLLPALPSLPGGLTLSADR